MATAKARKKVPVTPVMEIRGKKTTMGVRVEPISGTVSSLRALWRLLPADLRRRRGAERCSRRRRWRRRSQVRRRPPDPPRVIMLKLWPMILRTTKVTQIVSGTTKPARSGGAPSRAETAK